MVTDKRGRVVLANEAFAKWVGKDPDKLIGQDSERFDWRAEVGTEKAKDFPWARAIQDGVAQPQFYLRLADKDGRMLTLVANSSPVLGHDGKYRGVLTSFEDITELQQNRVELSEARDLADAANRAKSDFLAHMSHEIRTPMNAILGFTEILQRGLAKDEKQRSDYLQTIQSSGQHLLTLINDILDLSKIESGKMELELDRHAPMDIVSQALSIFELKASEKGLSLSCKAKTWLPETVLVDAVRLRQVVINLVGNAIKFTERGSVRIEAGMVDGTKPMLRIDIIDSGIGISAQAIEKIFDPFSQEDSSITRRFGGTGLGLSICRQLAELMGGNVTATSTQGKGSTFTITIDPGSLTGIAKISPQELERRSKAASVQQDSEIRLPPCRVLVVDDGAANRQLVTVYLERAGAVVTSATNGLEACESVAKQEFDAVVMDVHMPVMDGVQATRRMRASGTTIPIIALTGNVMKDDEASCRAAGYTGFLAKPIRMNDLLSTVARLLGKPHAASFEDIDPIESIHDTLLDLNETLSRQLESDVTDDQTLIDSNLPLDDIEIRTIVQDFVLHLRNRILILEAACENRDFHEVEEMAHWLKGAGGSLGFPQFTKPARDLENAARANQSGEMLEQIRAIRKLTNRVRSPNESPLVVA